MSNRNEEDRKDKQKYHSDVDTIDDVRGIRHFFTIDDVRGIRHFFTIKIEKSFLFNLRQMDIHYYKMQ